VHWQATDSWDQWKRKYIHRVEIYGNAIRRLSNKKKREGEGDGLLSCGKGMK